MRPLLGSGNTNLPSLLQSLLGMQHRPGVSTLYLGTLNLSQNELSNSSLYFIEVTLAETSENSLTTLETRVGLSRQPLPTEEWEPRGTRASPRRQLRALWIWHSLFQMPLTRNIHKAIWSPLQASVWFWSSRLIEIHLQSSHHKDHINICLLLISMPDIYASHSSILRSSVHINNF